MKRLVLILGLVLLLALAACDTMGPATQEALPTDLAPAATSEQPALEPTAGSSTGEQPEGTAGEAGADLQGVTWEWVSLLDPMGQTTAVDPTRYTVTFNAGGTANVRADCNNVVANYFTDGVNLVVEPGVTSLAACPEDTQDQLFLNSLAAAESYVVQDGELFVTMTGASGTIIFRTGAAAGSGEVPSAGPALTGVTWEWVSTTTPVETITAADPTRYAIVFNEDGTANVTADCNSVTATYGANEDSTMAIVLGASTMMACPEDSQADLFTGGLSNTAIYSFVDGDLLLDMPASAGTMRFRAAGDTGAASPDVELTGIVWQWVSTTTPAGEVAATDPARYAITFNADGTAGITADCNVGNAEYTAGEDGSLGITLGVSTLAFCENSQDTQFREGLAAAAVYYIDEGDLFIDLADGAGTMRFRNGGAAEGATPPATADTLTGVTWEWVKTVTPVEEIAATDQTRYNIVFNEDGTANIKADCNAGTATYTAGEDGTLSITPGAMTLAMCPEDSQATQFMAGLSAAAIYFFQDGHLLIDQFASSGTMHFAPAATAEAVTPPGKGEGAIQPGATGELVGTVWQMNMIAKTDGNITFNGPDRYTVAFNADGTLNYQADCNVGGGTYTTGEGGALTIMLGPTTLALCPPGSLDQIFLGGLTNAMSYRMEDGGLLIDMLYESGTMMFSPQP